MCGAQYPSQRFAIIVFALMPAEFPPRRSALFMPGANQRAMAKARELNCDAVIFDLEDAVAPDAKALAREQVAATVNAGGYGDREVIVRVNGLDTPWGEADVAAIASLPVAGVLFPKVQSAADVTAICAALDRRGARRVPVWVMIETPRGVLAAEAIATASSRVEVLVMGTSDLVAALRARHTTARHEVVTALAHCVLVARATERAILDGVHLDFRNAETFRVACVQARDLGFDGKTLIHPDQIAIANAVFGINLDEVEHARAVIAAANAAQASGRGVAVLEGRLIENLHVAEAERILAQVAVLAARRRD